MRPATATLLGALWITAQLAVPVARAHPGRTYPLSGRFSWTMFAGPLVGRCHHDLTVTREGGGAVAFPPPGEALRTVLDAHAPAAFSQAVWLFAPYVDDDAAVAAALDDLLRRWSSTLPTDARVQSALRCASPGVAPFSRTLSLGGGAR